MLLKRGRRTRAKPTHGPLPGQWGPRRPERVGSRRFGAGDLEHRRDSVTRSMNRDVIISCAVTGSGDTTGNS